MYFSQFPKIFYDFPKDGVIPDTTLQILTDITTNIRVRKEVLENISLYDEYDILEGETPEMIAEKIYGNPELHWVLMIVNQRYDYLKDFPMSSQELNEYIADTYGENGGDEIHHYEKNGLIVEGMAVMKIPSDKLALLRPNDFIMLQPKASAKILSLSYEFDVQNAVRDSNVSTGNVVKLYDEVLLNRTDSNYIGTAVVHSYKNRRIILGQLNLLEGKSQTQIKSTFVEDGFEANLNMVVSGFGLVTVMLDYGRFNSGDLVTVNGVRFDEETQTYLYRPILNYQIPTNGFDLNDLYFAVTNYEYEFRVNESKRRIKIISPRLINQIVDEFRKIVTP